MSAPTKLTSERHVQVACSMHPYLREVLRLHEVSPSKVLSDYALAILAEHADRKYPPIYSEK